MWFEDLMGFSEEAPEQVRENIVIDGNTMKSLANGREFTWGELDTPSLGELRKSVEESGFEAGKISVREIVANVQQLHADASNAGALFQVASQFNLLEMGSPHYTPEDGVGIYQFDLTQGPACAIAAGAGTIYRNYFASVNGKIGQSEDNQIDCLADLGAALGNSQSQLWEMKNGYALATKEGLAQISAKLQAASETELDRLRQLLRIGIQRNTQVTISDSAHLISQVYGSALPVAYSRHPSALWAAFAKLVLEASYEATICAAILNAANTGNNRVFLTMLGGGAFGNEPAWTVSAMRRALEIYENAALDIAIVSYGAANKDIEELLAVLS